LYPGLQVVQAKNKLLQQTSEQEALYSIEEAYDLLFMQVRGFALRFAK
jgi:hypothetical protein